MMGRSGKQSGHTVKNVLLVNALLVILLLSDTHGGRTHDRRIAEATPSPLPAGSGLVQDLGFLSFTLPQVEILMPTKKLSRWRADAGARASQPSAPPAAAPDRAWPQQRQAVSHGQRPHPPVEGGHPRSRDGTLLCPAQLPGTFEPMAANDLIVITSTDVKGNDLAGCGIHSDPHPLLVGFLLHKAGQLIRFHLKALDQHSAGTRDGLDMPMSRQGREALDQTTQEPREGDAHRTTAAAQRNPLHQQAFDQTTPRLGDEVWLAALDKLAPTIVAVMLLLAIMNMAIFLQLGGLAPWTDVSNNHGVLLTSAGGGRVFGQPEHSIGSPALHGVHDRRYFFAGLPCYPP